MVVQSTRFINGKFDDFLGARCKADIAGNCAIPAANDELNGTANLVELNAEISEDLSRDAFTFTYKPEQKVLSADVVVVKALRLLLCKLQDFSRPLGEFIEAICHLTFT